MSSDELSALPTPESIAAYVRKNAARVKKTESMTMTGDPESVREADYRGHHITVRTTYHMEVDGKPLGGHLAVTNEGQVQYHGLPNYSFDSAIGLIQKLIDTFPEDFEKGGAPPPPPASPGMGHDMAGMKMSGMGSKAAAVKGKSKKKS